jgi:predicted RNase H-like HicB family nuclease
VAHAYTVLVHKGEDSSYWAEVEELPGCFGSGLTLEELGEDIKNAIEYHIEGLRDNGLPVPEGKLEGRGDDVMQWAIQVA